MSFATITISRIDPIIAANGFGVEPGDLVVLDLNNEAVPALPDTIEAAIQVPITRVEILVEGCRVIGYGYTFGYDTDDLDGGADELVEDLISDVTCAEGSDIPEPVVPQPSDCGLANGLPLEVESVPLDFETAGAMRLRGTALIETGTYETSRVAGLMRPTGILTNGKQTYTLTGIAIAGVGLEFRIFYSLTNGWSLRALDAGTLITEWVEGAATGTTTPVGATLAAVDAGGSGTPTIYAGNGVGTAAAYTGQFLRVAHSDGTFTEWGCVQKNPVRWSPRTGGIIRNRHSGKWSRAFVSTDNTLDTELLPDQ